MHKFIMRKRSEGLVWSFLKLQLCHNSISVKQKEIVLVSDPDLTKMQFQLGFKINSSLS